jgi:hypothetical protein
MSGGCVGRRRFAAVLATAAIAVGGLSVVVASSSAGAVTTVTDEAGLRAAFASGTSAVLANNISLTDCAAGRVTRTATNGAFVLDGAGFKITQTCAGLGVLGVASGSSDAITVKNVTLTGGTANSPDSFSDGGGALEDDGTGALTIDSVVATGNTANNDGGAMNFFGPSTVTVSNSTFSGNNSGDDGGAIDICATTTVTITGSTFSGNSNLGQGGAIDIECGPATLTLLNSTVTGTSSADLGAIGDDSEVSDTIVIGYSTIVGNTATNAASPASVPQGQLQAADQNAHPAAAVLLDPANLSLGSGSTLTIFGSVIAKPTGGPNCAQAYTNVMPLTGVTSTGYNYADDTSCGLVASTDNQATTNDPQLGALAANGGPTQTMLPQTGSPLIDAIPNSACQTAPAAGITADQRALPRPEQAGGKCDIGAVEVQLPPAPPAAAPLVVIAPKFTG